MISPQIERGQRGLIIAQLVLGVLGVLVSLGSILFLESWLLLSPSLQGQVNINTGQTQGVLWIAGLTAILAIPSIVHSARRLNGKVSYGGMRRRFLAASILLLLIPLLILLGQKTSTSISFRWLTSPVNVFLVLIPIWWFVEFGRFQLSSGSLQRQWALVNFSVFLTLPLTILVEVIVVGIALVFGSMWLIQQPDFAPFLEQILQQYPFDPLNFQLTEIDVISLLQRPDVITAAFLAISLVIPMVEEALKPLAVWFLVKREFSPAEGFSAGLICGASFALIESSFSLSAITTEDWLFTIVGRVGTGLLHILTAGLNGWALAASWKDGKYLRTGFIFVFTVLIHGVWNFLAVLMGITQMELELQTFRLSWLTQASGWILAGLAAFLLTLLFFMNRHLRRKAGQLSQPDTPPLLG